MAKQKFTNRNVIPELEEVLGEMGFKGDVTSSEARRFWEKNKGNVPQRYIDKYGIDGIIQKMDNNFFALGQKSAGTDISYSKDKDGNLVKKTYDVDPVTGKTTLIDKEVKIHSAGLNDNTKGSTTAGINDKESIVSDDEEVKENPMDSVPFVDTTKGESFSGPEKSKTKTSETATNPIVQSNGMTAMQNNVTDNQNAIMNEAVKTSEKDQEESRDKTYEQLQADLERYKEMADKNDVDSGKDYIPTSMFKAYKNGEFGKPGTSDARIRMGYLITNSLASGLKQMSNNFAAAAGRSPVFTDTESDWNKYKRTNLEQGLMRSNEKKAQMQKDLLDFAQKYANNEQELRNYRRTFAQNAKLQQALAKMDEEHKRVAFDVLRKIGNDINKMNNEEFAGYLTAAVNNGMGAGSTAALLATRYLGGTFGEWLDKFGK